MELSGNIRDNFGRPTPHGSITVTESYTFRIRETSSGSPVPKTVYMLNKAPFESLISVTIPGQVDDELGPSQFESRDTDGDGRDDSVAFTDSDAYPDDGDEFLVTYVADPLIGRYADGHEETVDIVSKKTDDVIDSHQVEFSSGSDLDRLGSLFGLLGTRDGRGDESYRAVIRSVVSSFNGNGTKPGLKKAIARATKGSVEDVTITEDFEQVGYSVNINNTEGDTLSTSVINEIIRRSDPAGVDLLRPPVLAYNSADLIFETNIANVSRDNTGLGNGFIGDGNI